MPSALKRRASAKKSSVTTGAANTANSNNISRFDSVSEARICGFIDQIERMLERGRELRRDSRRIRTQMKQSGFEPKLLRATALLRTADVETHREEQRLLVLYSAADKRRGNRQEEA